MEEHLNDYDDGDPITVLKNGTAHDVTFIGGEGKFVIPPSGHVARVGRIETPFGTIGTDAGAIPLTVAGNDGIVTGLPDPDGKTVWIVSREACEAGRRAGRRDLYAVYGLIFENVGGRKTLVGATGLAIPAA